MVKSNKRSIKNKVKSIYLDYAASVEPNPSSIHQLGVGAQNQLQSARKKVAGVLNARMSEIIWTSGGTESNNLAIQGIVVGCWTPEFQVSNTRQSRQKFLPHIITTNIEHPSVLKTFEMLQKRKLAEISIVPVEVNGIVDPKKIKKEIKKNTILISVMYANNEIGTIQPIKEIGQAIRQYKKTLGKDSPSRALFFHTDAVQAVNYLDLNVETLGVDLLSLSGSKIEGAGRVGVLYKRKGVALVPLFSGGDQEAGLRPGTENTSEIIKFANALEEVQKIKEQENKRLTKLRDYFMAKLLSILSRPRVPTLYSGEGRRAEKSEEVEPIINGDLKNRLPNNVNVTFPKIPSDLLIIELSERGIMASAKSACESSQAGGSYVIKALRRDDGEVGGLRFSLGRQTTKKDIDYTVKILSEILLKLKKWYD